VDSKQKKSEKDSTLVIGIDPGKNGGIVSLYNGKIKTINSMPPDINKLWEHFLFLGFPRMLEGENVYVYIEDIHSMPSDGVSSAFSFGRHRGHLEVILNKLCKSVPILWIRPSDWMAFFNLKRDKKESKYNYKKRILEYAKSQIGTLKKQDLTLKTCDAYLIALYGYVTILNQQKESK